MQRVCALSGEQLAVNWFRGGGGGGGGECSGQLQLPEVGGEGELGELGNDLEGVREKEKERREQGRREQGRREQERREQERREQERRERGRREQDKSHSASK